MNKVQLQLFLQKHRPTLMERLYKKIYKAEIRKFLEFFYRYKDIPEGINITQAIDIISLENDWHPHKTIKIFSVCKFLKFIDN